MPYSKYHLFPSLVITMTLIIARMVEGLHRLANNFPFYSSVHLLYTSVQFIPV